MPASAIQDEHDLAYCQRHLHAKQASAQEFGRDPIKREQISAAFRTAALDFMRRKSEQWRAEIAWAQSLREQIVSRLHEKEIS